MLRALAVALALVASFSMALAIRGMVIGRPGARAGLWLRVLALLAFAAAVLCAVLAQR